MPSIGRMLEPEAQSAIGRASFAAIHAMSASQLAAPRAGQAFALSVFAAEDVVIFRLPIDCRRYRPWQARGECKARRTPGESDKCDGISMDSLITAVALALAAGDPLAALKRVALRGIAMAQLGEHTRAKELLRSAARAFGPKEATARARCVVAEAEIALVSRDLGGPMQTLGAARAALEARGDRANAAHAGYLEARRLAPGMHQRSPICA
jgi:hypothetical protein